VALENGGWSWKTVGGVGKSLENGEWSWKIIGNLRLSWKIAQTRRLKFCSKIEKKTVLTYFSLNKIIGKWRKKRA